MKKYALNSHLLFLMKLAYGIGFIYLGLITQSLILLVLIIALYLIYVYLELSKEVIKLEILPDSLKLVTLFKKREIKKKDLDLLCIIPKKENAFTHRTIVFNENLKLKNLYWNKKVFAELLKELDEYDKKNI